MKRLSILALAAMLAMPAMAQQAQSVTAPARAANAPRNVELNPDGVLNAALQVAQMIDAGRAAELWDGASAVTRRFVQRRAFVGGVDRMRAPHGVVQGRAWTAVRRQQIAGTQQELPAGVYISVEFATQAAGKMHRELVTFRADEDGTVRLSGYVME